MTDDRRGFASVPDAMCVDGSDVLPSGAGQLPQDVSTVDHARAGSPSEPAQKLAFGTQIVDCLAKRLANRAGGSPFRGLVV
jgi:hypothetical protein